MASKRMFAKDVIHSDSFLDMPLTSQALYFHLGVLADDDGFVQPKMAIRLCGAKEDDLKILLAKGFLIEFSNGVLVQTHWWQNNDIKKDRYHPTVYQEQYKVLTRTENKSYKVDNSIALDTGWIQNGYEMDTQSSLGKSSLDKTSVSNSDESDSRSQFSFQKFKKEYESILKDAMEKYQDRDCKKAIDDFIARNEAKNYRYKNYKQAFYNWVREDKFNQYNKKGGMIF